MRPAANQGDRVNILLVDDRPGNLLSLKGVLERDEYNLMLAESGEEALALVLRHDFAVILLDVAMPTMDGFEVATIIKQRESFKHIPIIFVTASVQNIEWIFRAYSVGAVDFLHKPLDPHAVRAKVAVFVELFRQKRELERLAHVAREVERQERELAIARLKGESEQRYRHLAEAIPHVVWTALPDGQLEYVSERWVELTGRRQLLDGAPWRELLHPEDVRDFENRWRRGIGSGEAFELECRLHHATGGYRWYLCRALPESNVAGRLERWLGTLTDVDERKRALEAAEAAVRVRDEFLSVASHELRTPLSALQLQLQSMLRFFAKGDVPEMANRLLRKLTSAVRQTERLSSLIDNLLDVSRITTGRLDLDLEELDLAEAVRDVAERLKEDAAHAGCELVIEADPLLGLWDRLRLEQVLTNLLANAIKYAPGKPIDVRLKDAGESIVLEVHDRGIGIEPEHLRRIFERFERAVPSHHYGGLGLGLYIVRQIVQAHGGQVAVDSQLGIGSTFRIELPRRASQKDATPANTDEVGREHAG